MQKTLKFLIQPLPLAFLLATIIIMLLPNFFNKYKVEISNIHNLNSNLEKNFFYDLDGDGIKERVQAGNDHVSGKAKYIIYKNTFSLVDQYNWKGKYFNLSNLVFGDYNNNGLAEIYSFTVHNDSLFVNGMEYKTEKRILNNLFVRLVDKFQGDLDIAIQCKTESNPFLDTNNDGYKELIFDYQALYSGIPRITYALDINRLAFNKSEVAGANLCVRKILDIDNDGNKELIFGSSASANNKQDSAYSLHDYSAWLVIYDQSLQKMRALFETSGVNSSVGVLTLEMADTTYLFACTKKVYETEKRFTINLLDANLNTLRSKVYTRGLMSMIRFLMANGTIYLIEGGDSNKIFELDLNMNKKLVYEHPTNIRAVTTIDIENDGLQEFVITTRNPDETSILTHDFKHSTIITGIKGSVVALHNANNEIAITSKVDKKLYFLPYKTNPYYYAKYPFYVGVYLVLYLLFYYSKKYRNLKLAAANQQQLQLQLKALKNQIDPHFTFNVINSISMVIAKGDLATAQKYFEKFSSLLRNILDYSDKVVISLDEEIEIIKKYLELEKIRFKEKVNYTIEVDSRVDLSIPIPRMLLQHHVENAIKHGLMHKKKPGDLWLKITEQNLELKITIQDNGIGRKAAIALKIDSTGKGGNIDAQLLKFYHQLYGVMIIFKIEDLINENNDPVGTKVIFTIPLKK